MVDAHMTELTPRGAQSQKVSPSPVGNAYQRHGVPLGMHRIRPEYLDLDASDRSVSTDVLVREEPEAEEEDEENEQGEGNEEDNNDGYSE